MTVNRQTRKHLAGAILFAALFAGVTHADGIRVDGASALMRGEIATLLAPHKNRPVPAETIVAVINRLNTLYRGKGYVNSGVRFARLDQDGTVILEAVEGKLSTVELQPGSRFPSKHIEKRVRHRLGAPFNVNELKDVFGELERDPAIKAVRGELKPGSAPGEANLNLEVVDEKASTLSLSINNYRSPSIGSTQAELEWSHINLTGHSDALRIGLRQTEGLTGGSVSYSSPLFASRTHVTFAAHKGDALVVEAPFDAIDIESDTDTLGLSLLHHWLDTKSRTGTARLGIEKKTSQTRLLGMPFDFSAGSVNGESRASVLTAGVSYHLRGERQSLALGLTLRKGLDLWRATQLPGSQPDGDFSLLLLQASLVRLVAVGTTDVTLNLRATLQTTDDSLQAFERYALGGHSSLRGFRENQVLRDSAWALRSQVEIPWRGLNLYPFVDLGEATNSRRELNVRRTIGLSSFGLGVRYQRGPFTLSVEAARRLEEKSTPGSSLQDDGVHLGVRYAI